eukprot:scaffold14707_cov129-Isochrysis_galbana.AAC.6
MGREMRGSDRTHHISLFDACTGSTTHHGQTPDATKHPFAPPGQSHHHTAPASPNDLSRSPSCS